ncbi:MAG TPA: NUDIX hydrolase [Pirellulales bacterium]|nr:NUDIX hydrolase [Pirellulales bacterium]
MANDNKLATVYAGRHLSMVVRGDWEFATRNTKRPSVGIVAITNAGKIVLVEQYRPPVSRPVVELPAGLAGDVSGAENEALVEAAKRELLEETGYVAARWTELGSGYTSPGLTDESIVLFLAQGLTKQSAGGGDGSEQITIHEIPLEAVAGWLHANEHSLDLKLLAGLYAAQAYLKPGG